jgi:hypothetical protein
MPRKKYSYKNKFNKIKEYRKKVQKNKRKSEKVQNLINHIKKKMIVQC